MVATAAASMGMVKAVTMVMKSTVVEARQAAEASLEVAEREQAVAVATTVEQSATYALIASSGSTVPVGSISPK